MLRTTKLMKDKYEKIQKYLFSMIPEKWDEIYLYASVDHKKSGELYFYYLPKGILKKKPVNVYEIPQKFNINEEEYLKVVQRLYNCIKKLHQDFVDSEQEIWNSLTITIANLKFKVQYDYDLLPKNEQEREEKRIIWRYKYLGIGGEKRNERKILDNYFENKNKIRHKRETYETGLYIKNTNNEIIFGKEENKPKFEKEEKNANINPEFQKIKKHHNDSRKKNINKNISNQQNDIKSKNQILNM